MKKNNLKNIASAVLAAVLMVTSGVTCFASEFDTGIPAVSNTIAAPLFDIDFAFAGDATINKIYGFLNDPRWRNGTFWNANQGPKSSPHSSSGCCAYVSDYAKEVFGVSKPFADCYQYTDINKISTGDVVRISGHYFVVIKRSGNTLTCAEGNWQSKVVVGRTRTILASENRFNDSYRKFEVGYHYSNYRPSFSTPSAPSKVKNIKATKTTKTSVSLSWSKVSGTGVVYEIWDGNKRLATTTSTSYTHSGLKAKSTHTYQVRAYIQYVDSNYTVQSKYGGYSTGLVVITKKK